MSQLKQLNSMQFSFCCDIVAENVDLGRLLYLKLVNLIRMVTVLPKHSEINVLNSKNLRYMYQFFCGFKKCFSIHLNHPKDSKRIDGWLLANIANNCMSR